VKQRPNKELQQTKRGVEVGLGPLGIIYVRFAGIIETASALWATACTRSKWSRC
jgi:hypothetical protein